jgi:hypothetical protein
MFPAGVGFSAVAAAEPVPLTLACKGTSTDSWTPNAKPLPVSQGVAVNFAERTVQGFGTPGLMNTPVKITGVDDVTDTFSGSQQIGPSMSYFNGAIDRVTGDMEATSSSSDAKTSKTMSLMTYALKRRPAQRMF